LSAVTAEQKAVNFKAIAIWTDGMGKYYWVRLGIACCGFAAGSNLICVFATAFKFVVICIHALHLSNRLEIISLTDE
jgi:hypothetical protein